MTPKNMLCPYCGGITSHLFSTNDINQHMTDEVFDYRECLSCGIVYLCKVPSDIHNYYGKDYSAYRRGVNIQSAVNDYDLAKIELVKRYATASSLLEIGPGNGTFAYLAKKNGFAVDAVEMDLECSKFISETIGVRRCINSKDIVGSLAKLDAKYDVIVMWHVLEHLEKTWDVLELLPSMLAPAGIIILAAPNPKALQFKIFGKYWKHVDAPRHLVLVPLRTLKKMMGIMGLDCVLATTNDDVCAIFNSYGWWLNSLNSYLSSKHDGIMCWLFRKRWANQGLYDYIIKRCERINGLGNTYLVVFKKPI